eukprot:gnl/TRDRNA2_/TRDRNA2_152396_c0_seq10.p1 gnl/TRDRNA2_/TRDRNA2_152396_c0~~gnl/TRDRNA2_/TRDRNA2_152396_c0_seq10.p1  ORF type:complete len:609 (-),score=138.64 gnl/TRDRNA2_/TRDRNA2_152396_c0_seq10:365-2191(-)
MASSSSSSADVPAWPKNSVVQKADGTVAVEWSDADLTDTTLEQFVAIRLSLLLGKLPKSGKPVECCVNLSGNQLRRPEPIAQLLAKLREANVHLTALRLHKNNLTDEVAEVLAEHICEAATQTRPLMQLHLSDNELTHRGVGALIEATHDCEAYPRPENAGPLRSLGAADSRRRALWLRCEMQRPPVYDPAGLLQLCESGGYPVCVLKSKEERPPPTAVVQMPYSFAHPPESKGKGKDADSFPKGKGRGKTEAGERDGQQNRKDGVEKGKTLEARDKGKGNTKGVTGAAVGSTAGESMAWLKDQRQQGGRAGEEFEAAWKRWCTEHRLNEMTKSMRVESIAEFRQSWGAGEANAAAAGPSTSSAACASTKQETCDEDAAPENSTVSAAEVSGGNDSSDSEEMLVGSAQAAELEVKDSEPTSGDSWLNRAASTVRRKIEVAKLETALRPERTAGSEWQRLVRTGFQAMEHGVSQRARLAAGSFLDEEGITELVEECSGRFAMAAAYRSLHLGPLLAGGGSDGDHWQCTGALPAILGELLGEQGNDGAGVGDDANAIAARAIQDFVFLSSFARLCGGNDQAPKRDPLPNRRITAARSKANQANLRRSSQV